MTSQVEAACRIRGPDPRAGRGGCGLRGPLRPPEPAPRAAAPDPGAGPGRAGPAGRPPEELGIGTALTILVDVTLIRVVQLPVTMRLAGRATNRWAPRRLRRLRIREGEAAPVDDVLRREYA
ncbi:hypothetical protein [Streptomyces swartbergensis]|uniref:hypothetical protein n=1 Tax=Streptomyces swartbergensis TaxID=487165 RepID=UPI003808E455